MNNKTNENEASTEYSIFFHTLVSQKTYDLGTESALKIDVHQAYLGRTGSSYFIRFCGICFISAQIHIRFSWDEQVFPLFAPPRTL